MLPMALQAVVLSHTLQCTPPLFPPLPACVQLRWLAASVLVSKVLGLCSNGTFDCHIDVLYCVLVCAAPADG